MGLTKSDSKLLFYCKREGVSFSKLLTLGRLTRYVSNEEVNELAKKYLSPSEKLPDVSGEFADDIFKILGAELYVTVDYSAYEGATLVHDMNLPLPINQSDKYSCVLDSGTIEHVFNFPQAIKNCMQALEVGGHYIGITPANNLLGHGMYQFSPELYYRVFCEENGFEVVNMFLAPLNSMDNWYSVSDPLKVRSRVTVSNQYPLTLMVVARKMKRVPIFSTYPMQSDYVTVWNQHDHEITGGKPGIKTQIARWLPAPVKTMIVRTLSFLRDRKIEDDILGSIDPAHFKKIDL